MNVALALLLLSSTALADPCPRPKELPAVMPLLACPVRAEFAVCTARCGEHSEHANLYYREDVATVANRWQAALRAEGWKVKAEAITLDPDRPGEPRRRATSITAKKPHHEARCVVMPNGKGETLLGITHDPS
jgi:hypothetical protein